jgi:hypothetical protein
LVTVVSGWRPKLALSTLGQSGASMRISTLTLRARGEQRAGSLHPIQQDSSQPHACAALNGTRKRRMSACMRACASAAAR